jgi:hypothetical protein
MSIVQTNGDLKANAFLEGVREIHFHSLQVHLANPKSCGYYLCLNDSIQVLLFATEELVHHPLPTGPDFPLRLSPDQTIQSIVVKRSCR